MSDSIAGEGPLPLVWLVDDSPIERQQTERVLGPIYRFEQFDDGAEVVEKLAASRARPDVIILDWVMRGMSGDEVCRFLRSHVATRDLPIVMLTASRTETDDIVQSLALGANDYVAKPYAPEELRARIAAVIRAKQLSDIAARERARLSAINELGRRLFAAVDDVPQIVAELATTLTAAVCDGCAILLLPAERPAIFVARHRAQPSGEELAAIASVADPEIHSFESSEHAARALPPAYQRYIARFGLRGLAILPFPSFNPIQGVVTLTRDGDSRPFDPGDRSTIETCLEYASLAVQNAMRLAAERGIATERARVANFQEEMLGIVGHDLRNPIGAVAAGAELLQRRVAGNEEAVRIVTRIRSSAQRMERIVDQLLDVTRSRLGGGIPIRSRTGPLTPMVRAVVDELASAHPQARLQLVAHDDVEGSWDLDRLSQVVSNLVGNAIQYGLPEAPIGIEIAATEQLAVLTVRNAVRDQPIDPGRLRVLFDPYVRGRDGKHHASGLGLGLYIASEIVRAHRGTIAAESSRAGTVFRVELPRA